MRVPARKVFRSASRMIESDGGRLSGAGALPPGITPARAGCRPAAVTRRREPQPRLPAYGTGGFLVSDRLNMQCAQRLLEDEICRSNRDILACCFSTA